ncbi:hypothetical protein D3C71_1779980 [compost metagenome]
MIKMHVGQHNVCYRLKADTRGFKSRCEMAGTRKVRVLLSQSTIDENRLVATADYDSVQRPVESVVIKEALIKPGVA